MSVTDASIVGADSPVWARDQAFPPTLQGWGWMDIKLRRHPCESLEALAATVRDDPSGAVLLVWTPEALRMCLPDEVHALRPAMTMARDRWTREDLEVATRKLRWGSLLLVVLSAYAFLSGMHQVSTAAAQSGQELDFSKQALWAARAMLDSTTLGLGWLLFLVFVFIPWYQARKRRADLASRSEASVTARIAALRFDIWLELQRAPVTKFLLVLMGLVGLAQCLSANSISATGLVKENYLCGEWWRLLTAPFLHGNILHFLMNMAALSYLGKRLEVFARWPHLSMVFLFAACVGGIASTRLVGATSVGASGALMGWLGFLIVFETLHGKLVPHSARRRLIAGVLLTALIGLLGYRFIDNAAHFGGLLAGMTYAAIVFPKSPSPRRPGSPLTDRLAGSAALAVLLVAAAFAVWRISGG